MPTMQRMWIIAAAAIVTAATGLGAEPSQEDLNRLIRTYSNQRIVGLDINETFKFELKDGTERAVRVVSVQEHRDSVVKLVRRAEVRVEIDGRPLDLVCMPYVMPVETAGLRLLADSTSGWGNTSKRVQLSVWDAADPIVETKHFGFPLRNYRLFSHGTQCYDEPVHLGAGDDDPGGGYFYHDYGFDNAGFEARDEVVSAIDGTVVEFWPSREDLCSIIVRDANGMRWEHAHLASAEPGIALNTHVKRGQKIGMLGRSGPSGNFSHLHLGNPAMEDPKPETRLNLYPWLVTAYQALHPKGLLAVARPHHIALTGEKVTLDGSNSLIWGGGKIVEYRWVLPGGETVNKPKAETTFDKPGAYVAALWVKDDKGAQDVDFCQIKVYSKDKPEKGMPHIFMTYHPTQDIRPDQPVIFRFWFQGTGEGGPIKVDFDDGTLVPEYKSYTELPHRFTEPGIHIVTARCEAEGKPIEQKLKIMVNSDR
jgi:hypothetical protein